MRMVQFVADRGSELLEKIETELRGAKADDQWDNLPSAYQAAEAKVSCGDLRLSAVIHIQACQTEMEVALCSFSHLLFNAPLYHSHNLFSSSSSTKANTNTTIHTSLARRTSASSR